MGHDIFTEPEDFDIDTLRNLGPLTPLAGTWEGRGVDTHPVAEGGEDEPYRERIVFEPIDPQPNGPPLLYGLRYHVHVNKLDEPLTFHDQVDRHRPRGHPCEANYSTHLDLTPRRLPTRASSCLACRPSWRSCSSPRRPGDSK